MLVCDACDYVEPRRFVVIETAKRQHLHSPITLPEQPSFPDPSPGLADDLGFDMREAPSFR